MPFNVTVCTAIEVVCASYFNIHLVDSNNSNNKLISIKLFISQQVYRNNSTNKAMYKQTSLS